MVAPFLAASAMPVSAPRVCGCGHVVRRPLRCACEERRARERKQRHEARRPSARARGYSKEWDRAAKAFLKLNSVCRRPGCNAPATVVDHIEPHRGNRALFWNRTNWQPLCTSCHARWKQAIDLRALAGSQNTPERHSGRGGAKASIVLPCSKATRD